MEITKKEIDWIINEAPHFEFEDERIFKEHLTNEDLKALDKKGMIEFIPSKYEHIGDEFTISQITSIKQLKIMNPFEDTKFSNKIKEYLNKNTTEEIKYFHCIVIGDSKSQKLYINNNFIKEK